MYDIVVVGGGPAGLTAALYALRAGKRVLIIEKNGFGGQMTFSPKIENYPGYASISGSELADKMVDQVLGQGADVAVEEVKYINLNQTGTKSVFTDVTHYECGAVILATGAKHRLLGVPNETKFIGDGISFLRGQKRYRSRWRQLGASGGSASFRNFKERHRCAKS